MEYLGVLKDLEALDLGLLLPLDMDKESMDSGLWMVVL